MAFGALAITLAGPTGAVEAATDDTGIELTLGATVAAAVTRNPGLVAERAGTHAAEMAARGARAARAPSLVVGLDASDTALAAASGLAPVHGVVGLRWTTTWGMELGATMLTGDPVLSSSEPADATSVRLDLIQPLLHGAWGAGARHDIAVAELEAVLAQHSFEASLSELVLQVHEAYYALIFAEAEVETKRQALERAQQQLQETRRLIRKGVLSEIDVHVAEDNAVFFELEHGAAVVRHDQAQRVLAGLIGADGTDIRSQFVEGEDDPLPELVVLLEQAELHNPSVAVRQTELRLAQQQLRHARNEALPELDVRLSLSSTGTDPQPGPRLEALMTGQQPTWQAGMSLTLPLDVIGSAAGLESARSARDHAQGRLAAEQDSTRRAVEARHAELTGEERQLELANRRQEISQRKLDAEHEKYLRGLSTLDDVLRFQREHDGVVTQAERSRIEVLVLRAHLLEAAGLLLAGSGVVVALEGGNDA